MLLAHDAGTWEDPLVEGPSMALVNGKHHLFYGAGWWESDRAAIGYATCPGPMGGCTKRMPPAAWMATDVAKAGPAGPMLFSPDGGATWRVAYHAWKPGQVGYAIGGAGPRGSTPSTSPPAPRWCRKRLVRCPPPRTGVVPSPPAPRWWRNRQTRQLEGLVSARTWGFKSPPPHRPAGSHGPTVDPGSASLRGRQPLNRRSGRGRLGGGPQAGRLLVTSSEQGHLGLA